LRQNIAYTISLFSRTLVGFSCTYSDGPIFSRQKIPAKDKVFLESASVAFFGAFLRRRQKNVGSKNPKSVVRQTKGNLLFHRIGGNNRK
jgi:hypothetical protein